MFLVLYLITCAICFENVDDLFPKTYKTAVKWFSEVLLSFKNWPF